MWLRRVFLYTVGVIACFSLLCSMVRAEEFVDPFPPGIPGNPSFQPDVQYNLSYHYRNHDRVEYRRRSRDRRYPHTVEWGLFPKRKCGRFTASAYDLSYRSCGKRPGHKEYGITYSGYRLRGNRYVERTIAADRTVLPIGTLVFLEFNDERRVHYNGLYVVRDIGRKVVGRRVDIYMGESAMEECVSFGIADAEVYIVEVESDE